MNRRPRRRYTSPDGIDWRNPEMPVLRPWEFPDGTIGLKAVSPEDEQDYVKYHLAGTPCLGWQEDPSYRWGKRKRRGR